MPSDHDPQRMHPEMIPLVDALNRLPGITTHASCTGKDGRGMWVTFQIDSLAALTPLAYCLDEWLRVAWEPEPEDPSFFSLQAKRPGFWPSWCDAVVERIDEWLK